METTEPTVRVDCRGMACPGPITEVAKTYRKSENGDIIEILATDAGFISDIKAWAKATKNEIVKIEEADGEVQVVVRITGKKS